MKKILGLDLGTNSIGWALVEQDFVNNQGKILSLGSRIIPMSQDILGDFGKGSSVSQTAERTRYRSMRRLRERYLLRRERLHRVLNVLGFLPEHYSKDIDFENRFGKFKEETETKLPWKKGEDGKMSFLFNASFNEMVAEFKASGQEIKIPYDWTIYFLRKKALSSKITKEELAWLILNFNQKRGYYQLRGEDDSENIKTAKTRKYFDKGIVTGIVDSNQVYKGLKILILELENGNKGKIFRKEIPEWIGLEKSIIATVDIDKEGNDKYEENGFLSQRFSIPTEAEWETEWKLIKLKTEEDLKSSGKTVGTYIYETLLQKPTQKIRGKLVRTIERKFYKDELKTILEKQIKLQPELFTDEVYTACVRELYKSNEAHQLQLSKRDFVHLFVDDIIFYQRPLRSQKSSIGNCSLEYHRYKRKAENGEIIEVTEYLKAIPKSNPYYQEFRVWQWLYNLKIYTKIDDSDVTATFLKSTKDWENLFEFLMTKKEVNHRDILNYFITPIVKEKYPDAKPKALKNEISKEIAKYRWNYMFDDSKEKEDEKSKKYPMNETNYEICKLLERVENVPLDFLTREIEQHLWHIIYSVKDTIEYEKALNTFAKRYNLEVTSFVEAFRNIKPFKSEYGTYSEKAIKKLLPLMRIGKYWDDNDIPKTIKNRANAISERLKTIKEETEIDKIADDDIPKQILKSFFNLTQLTKGLRLYQASYLVYGRHSEAGIKGKWNSVEDLEAHITAFKQHSLRNPIVEQVITETLRVVKDIWTKYGNGAKDFFNEIHIELGREMKNPADVRKRMSSQISSNENTNQRIKLLLTELKNDTNFEEVRPFSPLQQDILKIYEEGALGRYSEQELKNEAFDNAGKDEAKNVYEVSRKAYPTKNELIRYKLWLEQKYCSPYTGQPIPLSKLFSTNYEIEHIIPQSRYFDDSLSNKVICESAINKLKDKKLGLEFIKKPELQTVEIDKGKSVRILTEDEYRKFVEELYSNNKVKRNKLLLEEIPEKMITRQMNDTRFISKYIMQVLSNIVRDDKTGSNDEGVNSKNIIPCNGQITNRLKQDWGLNDVWNELILPRFERMNELTKTTVFTARNKEGHIIPTIPLELSKGFSKKRIDHRHHALDALAIACATREHVNLLNNEHAKSDKKRFDLRSKLCYKKYNDSSKKDYKWIFKKPWGTNEYQSLIKSSVEFPVDAKNELEKIVVSFKQNLRVINKATNKYQKFENGKKIVVEQKGVNWAIRKPMHKEFIYAKVELPWVKTSQKEILTTIRKTLDTSFNLKKIESSITDTGIQKILKNYLANKENNPVLAFSPEGIEEMNKNIAQYNEGKIHQPIYKVRVFEKGTGRFAVGLNGNKKDKYVEAAKSTNLFFAVYVNDDGKRSYETIPLNVVIERQKQGLVSVPERNSNGENLLFHLSPNDLVYVLSEDEYTNNTLINFEKLNVEQKKRIYKVVSFYDTVLLCVNSRIANYVVPYNRKEKNKGEIGWDNKSAQTMEGDIIIKDKCIKIKVDRLGNISKA